MKKNIQPGTGKVITSVEIAQMIGRKHKELLRDIRKYISKLKVANIDPNSFFQITTYTSVQNKQLPCFIITDIGYQFIINKMTGQKGTELTAKYIISIDSTN